MAARGRTLGDGAVDIGGERSQDLSLLARSRGARARGAGGGEGGLADFLGRVAEAAEGDLRRGHTAGQDCGDEVRVGGGLEELLVRLDLGQQRRRGTSVREEGEWKETRRSE